MTFTEAVTTSTSLSGWDKFWSDLGAAFKNAWDQIVKFWAGSETEIPYIANFIFGVIFLILGIIITKLIIKVLKHAFKLNDTQSKDRAVKGFIVSTVRIILYFAVIVIFLLILRVEMSGLTQIFSSAILAIGLSLQDVISNFASGIIILSSKPFLAGEYIKIGESTVEGTVLDVRFLATTIETVNKQIVTIPNKTITSSILYNYTRNPLRRIALDIGVDYSTDLNKAKQVLIEIAQNDNRILEDPKPVCYVTAFESSDINLSLRCYVPNALYWDILFELNEKILIEFNKQNIEIPYNRLVVQTLDERGQIIKKKVGE